MNGGNLAQLEGRMEGTRDRDGRRRRERGRADGGGGGERVSQLTDGVEDCGRNEAENSFKRFVVIISTLGNEGRTNERREAPCFLLDVFLCLYKFVVSTKPDESFTNPLSA